MENETSKASFLGVALVMLVAVIVLGLAIFAVARGIMNNAQTSFVNTMDGASTAGLADFDGTTVSGVKVKSALEDYEGQNYMLLINTSAMQKKANTDGTTRKLSTSTTFDKSKLVVRESYGTNNADLNLVLFGGRLYAIYNAIPDTSSNAEFKANDAGYIEFSGVFKTDDGGMVMFNNQKINWKTSGCTEYISNSARFTCKLIKDLSGTITGIMFSEVYTTPE